MIEIVPNTICQNKNEWLRAPPTETKIVYTTLAQIQLYTTEGNF